MADSFEWRRALPATKISFFLLLFRREGNTNFRDGTNDCLYHVRTKKPETRVGWMDDRQDSLKVHKFIGLFISHKSIYLLLFGVNVCDDTSGLHVIHFFFRQKLHVIYIRSCCECHTQKKSFTIKPFGTSRSLLPPESIYCCLIMTIYILTAKLCKSSHTRQFPFLPFHHALKREVSPWRGVLPKEALYI